MNKINISINKGPLFQVPAGLSLLQLLDRFRAGSEHQKYLAIKNNLFASLNEIVDRDSSISFLNNFHESSRRAYENASILMLHYIIDNYFPEKRLLVLHSMCDGVYCELSPDGDITDLSISTIVSRFNELVAADLSIKPELLSSVDAIDYFEKHNHRDTAELIRFCSQDHVILYSINGALFWLPSPPAPSTGSIKTYAIIKYKRGFVLRTPVENTPNKIHPFSNQERLYEIFDETVRWGNILDITNISQLNKLIASDKISELIKISEALHEKKIAAIADIIDKHHGEKRLIFVAGPSSSGKTTFMKRLYIQLRVLGHRVVSLSLDNYFKDRDKLVRATGAKIDYESLNAIDLKLINNQLKDLLRGKKVIPPTYDFIAGKKKSGNTELQADKNTLFIIEGIHGINPGLTENIDEKFKFKIYLSALTHLNYDNTNRIPTHDLRLIRRIVRDSKYRGYSAAQTIKIWKSVVEGEKRYIFKHQGEADVMFNSSLAYEICALKQPAELALRIVKDNDTSHPEAYRLLNMLSYFRPINDKEIPSTSILREFIGDSSFKYH